MEGIIFKNKKTVTGIGSALVDILANENDDFLSRFDGAKGGMKLVDNDVIEQMLGYISGRPVVVPGGSACNTIVGIGKLGGSGHFVGKRGEDELGHLFENSLNSNNIETSMFKSDLPTGRVLSIITPDAQRSMFTYLGASAEMEPAEITGCCSDDTAVVHIEGYLVYNKALITAAIKEARNKGALVSLDLASFTVVEENKEFLKGIVKDYVDILIANEDEARVFTGMTDEKKTVSALSENAEIGILKVGAEGSYISRGGDIVQIEPHGTGKAVDTTGAGDLWASGFLFGLVKGYPLERCGDIGSACGYEVCQVVGTEIPEEGWERIKKRNI